MRWIALLALAGCSDGGGVQISVRENGTKATQVHLYLGTGTPVDRTPIFLGDKSMPLGTTYATRDPGGDADLAPVKAGAANFFFEPADASLTIPLVIAIGFDASGAIVGAGELKDVGVPDRGYLSYDLTLANPPDQGVTAWDETGDTPAPQRKCARLGQDMVVTAHDVDCDGHLDGATDECDPTTWRATEPGPRPNAFTCLTTHANAGPGCYGGGPPCTDGDPSVPTTATNTTDPSCPHVSDYCGPAQACPFFQIGPLRSPSLGTERFACTLTEENGNLCKMKLALPASQVPCWNALARNDQQSFQPSLTLPLKEPATLDVQVDDLCAITLRVEKETAADPTPVADSTTRDPFAAVVVADTGPDEGFLAPIEFSVVSGTCPDDPVPCTWSGHTTDRTSLCTN